jgi:hypothetical protein
MVCLHKNTGSFDRPYLFFLRMARKCLQIINLRHSSTSPKDEDNSSLIIFLIFINVFKSYGVSTTTKGGSKQNK